MIEVVRELTFSAELKGSGLGFRGLRLRSLVVLFPGKTNG